MFTPYDHLSYLFQDDVCGGYVAELLDYLDYAMMVERMAPPPLRRQAGYVDVDVEVVGSGTSDDPYDLTGDFADLPVATRLDFTIVCDELDNGGLFGARS
jgi:hypothetical protein